MLDSDVKPLGDYSIPDLLVDDDADSSRVDIENGAGAAVVVFIGHALVDGTIDDDVNVITNFVGGKGSSNVNGSGLLESLSELLSSLAPLTVAVGHL